MALKDWKKVKNNYHQVKWLNKIEDEKEIAIEPSGYGDWVLWYIDIYDSPFKLSKRKYKRFGNKSKAIAYANKYMRNN